MGTHEFLFTTEVGREISIIVRFECDGARASLVKIVRTLVGGEEVVDDQRAFLLLREYSNRWMEEIDCGGDG